MAEKITALVFDGLTGNSIEQELTADEITSRQQVALENQELLDALEAKIAARQSALAKLAALGLTEEEIAAL
jgi:DNA-binding NarL/FixJ family response regulator